jgi:group II intron reverse transcriptase/maturase
MHERGKSDNSVVPAKPPNKAGGPVAEVVEGRGLAKGNTDSSTRPGRSAGPGVPIGLDRVREVARKDKEARFTALLHHVDLPRLWAAYAGINPRAASGVDQVTWDAYGEDLRANLEDLLRRVHSGAYRASPSRRVYIPKPDGRQRPLGIATLEDKIVQRAVVEVLNAIFEEDFLGFSYGFRPGRGPHDALDALAVGITERKVNWILDADVSDFFSKLDQAWLMRFLEHRIADKRVLRLIRKWLAAGVVEDGKWSETIEGSPQGASVSPLLANVYLHYVFDRWVRQWSLRHARGDMVVTRFADDCVTRVHRRDRCRRSSYQMQCRARDGGRSSGVALQGEAPNHRKLRRLRAGVVSVAEKAGCEPVRCEPRRRAKANHSMTGRKRSGDIKSGVESLPRYESGRHLFTAQAVSGLKVARARFRLWHGTCEPVSRYGPAVHLTFGHPAGESENFKWQKPRGAE